MTCYPVNVKSGYAVWLGALARLDMVSGEDKHLTITVAPDVTIHRTPIAKASTVFIAQADKLLKPSYFKRRAPPRLNEELQEGIEELEERDRETCEQVLGDMVKHEITLNCTNYKLANYDIVIDGLGWISVQGKGTVTFILSIPPMINYHIRD